MVKNGSKKFWGFTVVWNVRHACRYSDNDATAHDTQLFLKFRIKGGSAFGDPFEPFTPDQSHMKNASTDQSQERAANYLTGSTKGWIKFVEQLRVNLPANRLSPPRDTGQGLPGQFNSAGHFHMDNDTAIIITVEESDARYQGIQIGDLWFNALDFRRRQTSLTTKQAYQSKDGKYRFVISAEDPGFENWLDPAGASTVFVFMRWQGIPECGEKTRNTPTTPDGEIVRFCQLGEMLKCEPNFTPIQREHQLAARHVSALKIPRGF